MRKLAWASTAFVCAAGLAMADSPDSGFMKSAAEGGISEVDLGQLAQEKAASPAVQKFGARMVKDHSAANDKLKALAGTKGVKLPESSSVMQQASKAKLNLLSGDSFDKSYIKGMVDDHKDDIKEFQKEAASGKDPEVKAFAEATLPTLREHLKMIQSIAVTQGVTN
jgi:putative membrane protein